MDLLPAASIQNRNALSLGVAMIRHQVAVIAICISLIQAAHPTAIKAVVAVLIQVAALLKVQRILLVARKPHQAIALRVIRQIRR